MKKAYRFSVSVTITGCNEKGTTLQFDYAMLEVIIQQSLGQQ